MSVHALKPSVGAILAEAPPTETAQLPRNYELAKRHLAECVSVDECKEWADKMMAIASYARQAQDKSLHEHATRIQARAMQRGGQLLQQFKLPPIRRTEPASAARGIDVGGPDPLRQHEHSSQRAAAAAAGLSKDQEKNMIRVANVPQDVFEAKVDGPHPPTIAELAELGTQKREKQAPPGFAEATRLVTQLSALASECDQFDPGFIAGGLHDYERDRIIDQANKTADWLNTFAGIVALIDKND